jgi:hypothetical protein
LKNYTFGNQWPGNGFAVLRKYPGQSYQKQQPHQAAQNIHPISFNDAGKITNSFACENVGLKN